MFLWPAHRCLMMQTTMALVFLGTVVVPGWAERKAGRDARKRADGTDSRTAARTGKNRE